MSYLLKYLDWKKIFEASFDFDPSGNYPDPTFGLPTGNVDSGKVSPGGADGDWDGSMQRALAFGKIANEFVGRNIISSQKRTRVKTAANNVSDHYYGQDSTYAIDLACDLETGDKLLAHLMQWFGHPEYTGGSWFNVVKDGYRYQIGWRVKDHFNHIHIGVKKVDAKDSVSGVSQPSVASTTKVDDMLLVKNRQAVLKLGTTGKAVLELKNKLKEKGFLSSEPNETFDNETDVAVRKFQAADPNPIKADGIVGHATYDKLYGETTISPAIAVTPGTSTVGEIPNKIVHSYAGEKAANINLLIQTMVKHGIANPYSQAGILSVIGKETNYIPKNEIMNYSKERLPEVWAVFSKTGSRVPKGQGKYNYNDLALEYENQPEKLANFVYGQKPYGMRDNAYGNTSLGDGWKYRGRGFNQVTFKSGYEKLGREIGMDLVSNPDVMNDPKVAAEVAIRFFKNRFKEKGIDPNSFTNIDDATVMFARANAGWGSNPSVAIAASREKAKTFSFA